MALLTLKSPKYLQVEVEVFPRAIKISRCSTHLVL